MNIEQCPYCPGGGDTSMSCTRMEDMDEFQVWCRDCWAHGPSRKTEEGRPSHGTRRPAPFARTWRTRKGSA